ncbi:MAG: isochorismate synthase MenF [Halodesulfurarchaeum sp.]
MATDDRDPESPSATGDRAGSGSGIESVTTRHTETDPVSVRQAVEALDPIVAVWDEPGEFPVLAIGREATVTGSGADRFDTVREEGTALLEAVETAALPEPSRPRLFGGVSFFETSELGVPWTGFEPASFVLPAVQVTLAPDRTILTGFGDGAAPDQLAEMGATLAAVEESAPAERLGLGIADSEAMRAERSDWIERVETVRDRIEGSGLEKAVLAVALDVELDRELPLGTALQALESRYPDCYRFGFAGDGADGTATFFGATPERLVDKHGRAVETEALAGTVGRGDTDTADAARIDRLLSDSTIGREHALVSEAITEQLRAVGADVTAADREVRTLANVHHLRTPISATLPADVHVLELVEELHPTPAVGGYPPARAGEAIRDVESIVRGWYGAPVGWFDAAGDGTFAVGIRSALARGRTATLFAGNGIVAGSDPRTEWTELEAKFQPIRDILA